ncbi:discoidin domain-containing protein [Cetobacterium sp.]|uniref:discoidin domain-containing protein n=1 Tax=Cetobacterium sp. TaxID=2071632 RepID=UPI003EE48D08
MRSMREIFAELSFNRTGNAPSSNVFKLKLNRFRTLKYLVLETQNNIFPRDITVTFNDFLENKITLNAILVETEGNIQKWELDPFLTDELIVNLSGENHSIINVTPVYLDNKEYFVCEDIDTRVPSHGIEVISSNEEKDILLDLKESKLVDRIKFTKNGNFELFYSVVDNDILYPIDYTVDENNDTVKFLPVMMNRVVIKSELPLSISIHENTDVYIFNYLSVEIENLFLNREYTELKPEVTMERIVELEKKTNSTQEYIEKLSIAKNILIGGMMGETIEYTSNKFKVVQIFNFITEESIHRIRATYIDSYGNEKSIETENILESSIVKVVRFKKFYAKDITFTIFSSSELTNAQIIEVELNQSEFYIDEDTDLKISSEKISTTTSRPNNSFPYSNLFDGNLNSQFHCNHPSDGPTCDIYFKLDKEYLIDKLKLMSYRAAVSGLVNKFRVLLKDINTENTWVELGEYEVETYENKWLEVKNKPYLTNEIWLQIEDSVNNWTLINELELCIHSNLEKEIKNLFVDASFEELRDDVTYDDILALESKGLVTEEYIELIEKAKELYLEKKRDLSFRVTLEKKCVATQVKIKTTSDIYRSELTYIDEYDYEIKLKSLNIAKQGLETLITFSEFYCEKFDILLDGDIEENSIEIIEIIEMDQKIYYEDEDIDVRVDKTSLTAESLCGQYSNNIPRHAIDNDVATAFHSADYRNYGTGEYGDFILKLNVLKVINRMKFQTRSSHNGRIKAYEILYKTSSTEEWKKVYEQLTEERGDFREAVFKPTLVSEICIRVTNGHNNFVFFNEIDLFKYNALEEKIANLFTDETQTAIKDSVTLEDIENLEIGLITESYINTLKKAKQLYIDTLTPEEFEITLNENTIVSGIKFIADASILRANIKYRNSCNEEFILENIVLEKDESSDYCYYRFNEIYTKNLKLIVYGTNEIYLVEGIVEPSEDFAILEDIDSRYNKDDISIDYYATDGVIYNIVKLKTKKLISRIGVTFSEDFALFYKDTLTENKKIYSEGNNKLAKFKPILTEEFIIRTPNRRIQKQEIELYIHNILEDEIDSLFADEDKTSLRENITFKDIVDLKKRVVQTQEYVDFIQLALDLFIVQKKSQKLKYLEEECKVVGSLNINLKKKLWNLYDLKIKYKDSLDIEREIKNVVISEEDSVISVAFTKIFTKEITVILYLDELELWKPNCIDVNELPQEDYYLTTSKVELISQDTIEYSSNIGGTQKPLSNAFDGTIGTNYYATGLGNIDLKLSEIKVIDAFLYVATSTVGNPKKGEIYYKLSDDSEWIFVKKYDVDPIATSDVRSIDIPPILASELRVSFTETSNSQIALNEINLKIYDSTAKKVKELFTDDFLTQLVSGITKEYLDELYPLTEESIENRLKVELAKILLLNNGKKAIDYFSIKPLDKNVGDYMNPLRINQTGFDVATPYYLKPNRNYIFVCNKSINTCLRISQKDPNTDVFNIALKSGINIINPGEFQGQMFIRNGRDTEIKMYPLNEVDKALFYKYGYNTLDEFYDIPHIDEVVSLEYANSNLSYVEGIHGLAVTDINWIKSNLSKEEFLEVVKVRDEFLEFLYMLVGANKRFDEPIPYKRNLWQGASGWNPRAGNGFTAYAGNALAISQKTKKDYSGWVVGHEVGHELDNNSYHMGLFGEVFNNWFSESALLEYHHGGGWSHDFVITDTEIPINEANYWGKLAFWFKFRYFYNDKEFIIKMNEYMQTGNAVNSEDAASRLAMFTSDILNRDTSDYFLRHSFPLNQEAIDVCKTYPPFAIPIWEINWNNREAFIEEERKLFLENFNSRQNI